MIATRAETEANVLLEGLGGKAFSNKLPAHKSGTVPQMIAELSRFTTDLQKD